MELCTGTAEDAREAPTLAAGVRTSTTVLILPFAYVPQRLAVSDVKGSCWRPGTDDAAECRTRLGQVSTEYRRRYFTVETSEVLFGPRSHRFRLDGPETHLAATIEDPNTVLPAQVQVRRPELWLFELPLPVREDEPSPLQTGLLLLELQAESGARCTLPQWCALNERARYVRKPFPEFIAQPLHQWVAPWLPVEAVPRAAVDLLAPWLALLERPLLLTDGSTMRLWPACWSARARAWAQGRLRGFDPDSRAHDECCHLHRRTRLPHQPMILPDDRAFVWSVAVSESGAQMLDGSDPQETFGWLKLLNVDAPNSNHVPTDALATEFEEKFVKDHTYTRWAPWSLYGFTPHSGVALVSPSSNPPLAPIFRYLYLEQCGLLLYLRSTLFGFSREISRISREMQRKNLRSVKSDFRRLELQFSLFTNLYQFPLLSHQQQGVEMYALQRRCLDINDFYKEIQSEIQHMDEVLDRRHDRSIRALGIGIAVVATTGVVWDDLGLKDGWSAGGFFGMVLLAGVVWGLVSIGLRQLDRN